MPLCHKCGKHYDKAADKSECKSTDNEIAIVCASGVLLVLASVCVVSILAFLILCLT